MWGGGGEGVGADEAKPKRRKREVKWLSLWLTAHDGQ